MKQAIFWWLGLAATSLLAQIIGPTIAQAFGANVDGGILALWGCAAFAIAYMVVPRLCGSIFSGTNMYAVSRDHAAQTFRSWRASIDEADEGLQLAFAIAVASVWKLFLAEHGSPREFAAMPRYRQMAYYKNLLKFSSAHSDDRMLSLAAQMAGIWLAAVINGDRELESETGQYLDAKSRQGWDFVNIPL